MVLLYCSLVIWRKFCACLELTTVIRYTPHFFRKHFTMSTVYLAVGSVTGTATAVAQELKSKLEGLGHQVVLDNNATVAAKIGRASCRGKRVGLGGRRMDTRK